MRWQVITVLFLWVAVLGGGGCVTPPRQDASPVLTDSELADLRGKVPTPVPRPPPDRLYPGDAVVLIVDEDRPKVQSRMEFVAVVQEDFTVALLSNKVFTTSGKTHDEMRREVHDYYVPKLFKSVRLMGTDPPFYIVSGEVWSPGLRVIYRPTTVLKAIELAGGFTPSANKKKVQLIGVGGERRIIDCTNTPRLGKDVEIARGDKIKVPRAFWK